MIRVRNFLLAGVLLALNLPAQAVDENLELAVKRGCLTCHQVKHDEAKEIKLAPSYEEIAAHYKDNKEAVAYLTKRVMDGTVDAKQNWQGQINMRFMPPNVNVSKIEADALVHWILGIKEEGINPKLAEHEAMLGLASRNGCTVCHTVDKNRDTHVVPLAPAYREIANHYREDKDARATLLDAVINGTFNKQKKWENVNMRFMPPNPGMAKEDAEKLVDWILGLE